jgi:hypothetical protein
MRVCKNPVKLLCIFREKIGFQIGKENGVVLLILKYRSFIYATVKNMIKTVFNVDLYRVFRRHADIIPDLIRSDLPRSDLWRSDLGKL